MRGTNQDSEDITYKTLEMCLSWAYLVISGAWLVVSPNWKALGLVMFGMILEYRRTRKP